MRNKYLEDLWWDTIDENKWFLWTEWNPDLDNMNLTQMLDNFKSEWPSDILEKLEI